jgi:hypothetical protein
MPTPLHAFVAAGLGFPSLLHAEAGWFATDRITVEAHYANVIFCHEVGLGASAWLLGQADGRPPRHSLLVTADISVNPVSRPFQLASGGDRLGAYFGTWAGWGYLGEHGLHVRAQVGAFAYADSGFAVGPDARVGVGWGF